jgi:predicted NodU family carbamoyl transferase
MVSVGVCADGRQTGAVIAVNGTVVSAVHVTNPPGPARFCPATVEALRAAGLVDSDVDVIVHAGGRRGASAGASASSWVPRTLEIEPGVAQASQLRAGLDEDTMVVVLDDHAKATGNAISVTLRAAQPLATSVSTGSLMDALARVAEAVGADPERPVASLCRVAYAHDERDGKDLLFQGAVLTRGAEVCVNLQAIAGTIADVAAVMPAPLAGPSVHIHVAQARRRLAHGILEQAADAIAAIALHVAEQHRLSRIGLAGSAFVGALSERLLKRIPRAQVAKMTGVAGAAVGAALVPHASPNAFGAMALGRAYSDEEIKSVLDNCRLDYICEPDANRLYQRVSELLRTGSLVGWFQGRTDFGGGHAANRTVLCDPSGRYARENVNVYLRGVPARDPLPVAFASSAADECGLDSATANGTRRSGEFVERWRSQLRTAIDERDGMVVHVPTAKGSPELAALLEWHRREAGIPGLITVPLQSDGVPAADPRVAVRAMFGSAVDALVIGRFLVSKDYWLIRSRSWRPAAAPGPGIAPSGTRP